jgi:NAD(P)-dependent dehydrogenase (short-subunit alcohol dehydrogenase family)
MGSRFENRVALVTGAGSGIGRAIATAFASEGARVMVADMNIDGAEQTVKLIADAGGEATAIKVDISDSESVKAMVKACIDTYGQLNHCANNAGILGTMEPFTADYEEETFDKLLAVNLGGTFRCMKYELPELLKTKGTIVNTASVAGLIGIPALSGYTASKHGVIGITKVAALEYAKQGVRVNALCPGGTRTPMAGFGMGNDEAAEQQSGAFSPNGRVAEPEEMANTVLWLSSDDASYVNGLAHATDAGYIAQ